MRPTSSDLYPGLAKPLVTSLRLLTDEDLTVWKIFSKDKDSTVTKRLRNV